MSTTKDFHQVRCCVVFVVLNSALLKCQSVATAASRYFATLSSIVFRPLSFWATVCIKRFAICYRTVVCPVCHVCDDDVLWPNGWMDQDATWHGGRPRLRPHCVRWEPSSPMERGTAAPHFSGRCLMWPNGRPSQQLLSSCYMSKALKLHHLENCFQQTSIYPLPDGLIM